MNKVKNIRSSIFKKAMVLSVFLILVSLTMVPVLNAELITKNNLMSHSLIVSKNDKPQTMEIVVYQSDENGRVIKHIVEMSLDEHQGLLENLQDKWNPSDSFEDTCDDYLLVLNDAGLLPESFSLDSMYKRLEDLESDNIRMPFKKLPSPAGVIDNTRCLLFFVGPGMGFTLGSRNVVPGLLGVDILAAYFGFFGVITVGEGGVQYTQTLDLLIGGNLLSFMLVYAIPYMQDGYFYYFLVGIGIAVQTIWYPFF
jgi:hypothetical protein